MSEEQNEDRFAGHDWAVEAVSVNTDAPEETDEKTKPAKPAVIAAGAVLFLASFALLAFFEPYVLAIPILLGCALLFWTLRAGKGTTFDAPVKALVLTGFAVAGAGYLVFRIMPGKTLEGYFPYIFGAGWVLLAIAVIMGAVKVFKGRK